MDDATQKQLIEILAIIGAIAIAIYVMRWLQKMKEEQAQLPYQ